MQGQGCDNQNFKKMHQERSKLNDLVFLKSLSLKAS